eukprot:TRINITY_DN8110_c0_g1_i1.p1 TRINITY_DN8110_c0_g1~~TRINITY_DN8110_c0_g1_i1.p1  ORF type:complete len:293 (-),score=45.11 TRINITY_DN8110_c0_g1_i1:159-1037(-)
MLKYQKVFNPIVVLPQINIEPALLAKGASGNLRYGYCVDQGLREKMEDAVFVPEHHGDVGVEMYAVYDGHGGAQAASIFRRHFQEAVKQLQFAHADGMEISDILYNAILSVDEEILQDTQAKTRISGSCGCVVAIHCATITVAHVGNYRAATCRKGGEPVVVDILPVDHSPRSSAEEKRLALANAEVSADAYVGGQLPFWRSFGGMSYEKRRGVICEPSIAEAPITEDLEFVLVASDGIFGVMSSREAVLTVRRALRQGESPQSAAESLVQAAVRKKNDHDLSALVVVFNKP